MDREQVLSRLYGRYCPAGAVLFSEGSPGEELFLVQSGAVRVVPAPGDGAADGETRGPGQVLGEEAFFGRVSRTCRAEAVEDSRLLRVCDRTLETVARHGPDVAQAVGERLLELAGEATRRLDAWMLSRQSQRGGPSETAAAPAKTRGLEEGD